MIKKLKLFKHLSQYLDGFLNIDNLDWFNFIHLSESLTKLMHLIWRPNVWICIYLFQTDLFHPKFMISAMSLILTYFFSFFFFGGDFPRSTSYGVYIF